MTTTTLISNAGTPGVFRAPAPAPASAPASAPRTAAGERAVRRRRARIASVRRPRSGVLSSSNRTAAVVTADRGDHVADRAFAMGRWARLTATLSLVAAAVVLGAVLAASGGTTAVSYVTVQTGDTLWSLARQADPAADPRLVVGQIRRLNGLEGDVVAAGAVLQVPTHG